MHCFASWKIETRSVQVGDQLLYRSSANDTRVREILYLRFILTLSALVNCHGYFVFKRISRRHAECKTIYGNNHLTDLKYSHYFSCRHPISRSAETLKIPQSQTGFAKHGFEITDTDSYIAYHIAV